MMKLLSANRRAVDRGNDLFAKEGQAGKEEEPDKTDNRYDCRFQASIEAEDSGFFAQCSLLILSSQKENARSMRDTKEISTGERRRRSSFLK
jgi:hypothetical protein